MQKKKYKNPVCILLWRDAYYAFTKNIPKRLPPLQLTAGFIVDSNNEFTNIAMNVHYNPETGVLHRIDGFLIPNKTIVKFKRIGNLNE